MMRRMGGDMGVSQNWRDEVSGVLSGGRERSGEKKKRSE